jgi:two-component system cell cycle response regulator
MPRFVRYVFGAGICLLGLHAAHGAVGFGGRGSELFNAWMYDGLMLSAAALCLARAWTVRVERGAWLAFGIGLLSYAAGEISYSLLYSGVESPPTPSLPDALYLGFYPPVYVGLVLLARSHVRNLETSMWLDGAIGALAIASVGAALIFEPIVASTSGGAAKVATDLAYPLADLLLLAVVAAVLIITGRPRGRRWGLIAASFVINGIADALYLYQSAKGNYVEGTLLDSLWPASTLVLAYAAWSVPRPAGPILARGLRLLTLPAGFALAAVGVLVYGNTHPVGGLAVWLAAAALIAVVARMAISFTKNQSLLTVSRQEALTDALTELGNRRALMRDLEIVLQRRPQRRLLVLFDLNGFKHYNDSYGHPAGDALLARLGRRLAKHVASYATAYRLGGDEFCVLAELGAGDPYELAAHMGGGLVARGKGFVIGACFGEVVIPDEVGEVSEALRIADQRLYAQKAQGRSSAGTQARDVLLSVLRESIPLLAEHLGTVGALSARVARRLDLRPEEREEVVTAAQLHDIGKAAIPEELLSKTEPLDPQERDFIRRHPIVGERILSAAPALCGVAKSVRASHENFDGTGYPDGLAGEEIPLAARIIAVCDGYDARVDGRGPRRPLEPQAALRELGAASGQEFDPVVVDALQEVLSSEQPVASGAPAAAEALALPIPGADE